MQTEVKPKRAKRMMTPEQKEAASKRGRSARTKGKVFERAVANALKERWPDARRAVVQARAKHDGCDVEGTDYWIECKHQKRAGTYQAIRDALEQADAAARAKGDERPRIVIWRRTGGPMMVSLFAWRQSVVGLLPTPMDHADTIFTVFFEDWIAWCGASVDA